MMYYCKTVEAGRDSDEVTCRKVICHRLKEKYPESFQSCVYMDHYVYRKKEGCDLPPCIVEGALVTTCEINKIEKTLGLLEIDKRCRVSYRYFTFNANHLVDGQYGDT